MELRSCMYTSIPPELNQHASGYCTERYGWGAGAGVVGVQLICMHARRWSDESVR